MKYTGKAGKIYLYAKGKDEATGYVGGGVNLYVVKFTPNSSSGITTISSDKSLKDAPAYNLAGQKVGKDYKGVIIKAGKKYIQK